MAINKVIINISSESVIYIKPKRKMEIYVWLHFPPRSTPIRQENKLESKILEKNQSFCPAQYWSFSFMIAEQRLLNSHFADSHNLTQNPERPTVSVTGSSSLIAPH